MERAEPLVLGRDMMGLLLGVVGRLGGGKSCIACIQVRVSVAGSEVAGRGGAESCHVGCTCGPKAPDCWFFAASTFCRKGLYSMVPG